MPAKRLSCGVRSLLGPPKRERLNGNKNGRSTESEICQHDTVCAVFAWDVTINDGAASGKLLVVVEEAGQPPDDQNNML